MNKYKSLPDNKIIDPKNYNLQSISIVFNDSVSHNFVLQQVVDKLVEAGWAPEEEIKEEWLTLLKTNL